PVFAWKGETLEEYWWCAEQIMTWQGTEPNMILDDGGDATMLVIKGTELEAAGAVPSDDEAWSAEEKVFHALLRESVAAHPAKYTAVGEAANVATGEDPTAVHRLYHFHEAGLLPFPPMNVNAAVTKSKFDNKYGTRHSLLDGINRGTDARIGGKKALVCGYGDVGKGCAEALVGQGARVQVTEVDPINALQALMDGFDVATVDPAVADADIIITSTGNKDIITFEHMTRMKNKAILGNI